MSLSRKLVASIICDELGHWTLMNTTMMRWNRDTLKWDPIKNQEDILVYIDDISVKRRPKRKTVIKAPYSPKPKRSRRSSRMISDEEFYLDTDDEDDEE